MRILGKMIEYGLLGIVLYTPFTFSLPNPRAQTIVHLATLILFLLWLLKLNGEKTSYLAKTPLYLPLLLFLIIGSISVVRTNFFYYSTQEFFRITSAFLLFFLVANNSKEENKFILPLILAANIVAFIGIQNYFRHSFSVAVSTLPNHNLLAGYLVISISLALGLFLFNKGNLQKRLPFLFLIILPLICLILAKSRGGLLSLMAALFVLILAALNRKKRWILVTLSLLVILLLFTPNPMMKRLIHIGEEDPHAYERLLVWRATLDIIKDYPLFGTGLGTFRDYYPQYKPQIGFRTAGFAHNEYLQYGAELGLIGLALALWFLILLFKHSKRLLFQKESGISIVLVSSMVGILAHSLVDFNLHTIPITTTFFYLLGLSVSSQRVVIQKPERSPLARRGIALLIIIVTLLYGTFLIQPYLARLYWKRGNLYLEGGKREEALFQYQRAIALQPRCPLYHKVLANLYWEEEYLGRALMEYKKAVNLYPRNVFYHRALGKFYEAYELWEEAREEYQRMVFLAPKVADFQLDLGRIYLKEGKYPRAKEIYQEALLLDPDNRIAREKIEEIAGFK